jgi:hypothetical protein
VKFTALLVAPATATVTGCTPLATPEGTVVWSWVVEAVVTVAATDPKLTPSCAAVALKFEPLMVTSG